MKGRKLSSDDIVNLQKLLRKLGQIAPRTRHTRLDYRASSRNGSGKFFRPHNTSIAPRIKRKESISLHHHQTHHCSPCEIPRDQHTGTTSKMLPHIVSSDGSDRHPSHCAKYSPTISSNGYSMSTAFSDPHLLAIELPQLPFSLAFQPAQSHQCFDSTTPGHHLRQPSCSN